MFLLVQLDTVGADLLLNLDASLDQLHGTADEALHQSGNRSGQRVRTKRFRLAQSPLHVAVNAENHGVDYRNTGHG